MRLEISTPDDHVGDLVGDLQQRRAIINQTQTRGHLTVIHAEAPLAELFGYSSAMRSLSQGRASCSMEPSTYAAAPDEVLKRFLYGATAAQALGLERQGASLAIKSKRIDCTLSPARSKRQLIPLLTHSS